MYQLVELMVFILIPKTIF